MKSIITTFLILAFATIKAQHIEYNTRPKDVMIQLFVATDENHWNKIEKCFSNSVLLDYSSMGNPVSMLTPKQITDVWKSILPGFAHTHHQIGNIQEEVSENKAHVFAYGIASHYLEDENGNVWTVVGTYNFELVKDDSQWKISKMKFNFKYQDGNATLAQKAINKVLGI
jgi:hypothetical protein